ncbi:MAG: hypothetical protein P4L22_07870 [Candidatus Babeliales bacterium]|nr:hypothetical protein [Candidatus Babeliales bacterium]
MQKKLFNKRLVLLHLIFIFNMDASYDLKSKVHSKKSIAKTLIVRSKAVKNKMNLKIFHRPGIFNRFNSALSQAAIQRPSVSLPVARRRSNNYF